MTSCDIIGLERENMEYGVECDGKLIAKFFDKSDAELFRDEAEDAYCDSHNRYKFSVVNLCEGENDG